MKDVVLRLARTAIGEKLGIPQNLSLDGILDDNPWLQEDGAVAEWGQGLNFDFLVHNLMVYLTFMFTLLLRKT